MSFWPLCLPHHNGIAQDLRVTNARSFPPLWHITLNMSTVCPSNAQGTSAAAPGALVDRQQQLSLSAADEWAQQSRADGASSLALPAWRCFLVKGTAEGCHTCRTVTLQAILICDAFCHLCVQCWKTMARYFKSHKQLGKVRKEIRRELEGNSWVVAFIPYSFLAQMHGKVQRNSKPRVVRIIHPFLDQVDIPLR